MSRFAVLPVAVLASSMLMLPAKAGESGSDTPVASYQLKNRSTFTTKETSRPPFWPIGYVKRSAESPVQVAIAPVPTTKLTPEMFSVTSILVGNPSLAIINGRTYGEGEYLRTGKGAPAAPRSKVAPDSRLRIRVARIADGQVTLQSMDGQSVSVHLRRPELNAPKSDSEAEALLSEQQ